jgi:hypothetical protein
LVLAGTNSTVFQTRFELVAELADWLAAAAWSKAIAVANPIAALLIVAVSAVMVTPLTFKTQSDSLRAG